MWERGRVGREGGWGGRVGSEGRGGEGGMTVIHIIIGMFNRPLSRKRHCNRE